MYRTDSQFNAVVIKPYRQRAASRRTILRRTSCALGAASSLSAINSTSTMVAFGGLQAIGNAVMRLEVDEVELISGNWSNSGFTIPVCGAHPARPTPCQQA